MGWLDCHLHEFEIENPSTGVRSTSAFPRTMISKMSGTFSPAGSQKFGITSQQTGPEQSIYTISGMTGAKSSFLKKSNPGQRALPIQSASAANAPARLKIAAVCTGMRIFWRSSWTPPINSMGKCRHGRALNSIRSALTTKKSGSMIPRSG